MGFLPDDAEFRREDVMNTDVRAKTEVWIACRRDHTTIRELLNHRGISTEGVPEEVLNVEIGWYHIQGIGAADTDMTAEQMALGMCRDRDYFIGPMPVNLSLSHERVEWGGMYYPFRMAEEGEVAARQVQTDGEQPDPA
jgi:hypothetical protein